MTTETVDRRTILRYRGEPVTHDVRFYGATAGDCSYRSQALIAECEPCGWRTTVSAGHTAADLSRLARHHAGIEDEDP